MISPQKLPREIQDLYDTIRATRHPFYTVLPFLWQECLKKSPLYNDSLTGTFCHMEDGDFLIVYEKNCYFFDKKPDFWDWNIKLVGRPEVLIEDEQLRDALEQQIPEVNWVLVNTDLNDDESNSQTSFQWHFFDRINLIIENLINKGENNELF
jgi:hypothetical protein